MKALYLILGLIGLLLVSCDPLSERLPPPTPPSSMPELLDVLANGSDLARIGAATEIGLQGSEAAIAVPHLIENLRYDGPYKVREAAAIALGRIGPKARSSVPTLIVVMQDDFAHTQQAAAWALGEIGDISTVPALVEVVYDDRFLEDTTHSFVMIGASEAIEKLTGQEFPGRQGSGYVDKDHVPIIVLAARDWWEQEGQFQNWSEPKMDGIP